MKNYLREQANRKRIEEELTRTTDFDLKPTVPTTPRHSPGGGQGLGSRMAQSHSKGRPGLQTPTSSQTVPLADTTGFLLLFGPLFFFF